VSAQPAAATLTLPPRQEVERVAQHPSRLSGALENDDRLPVGVGLLAATVGLQAWDRRQLHDQPAEWNEGSHQVGGGVDTGASGSSGLHMAERIVGELVGRHSDQKAPVAGLDQT